MNLIKVRKIFFIEVSYLVLITALYYGALRIHEANKNLIWHKLDTIALIALFLFSIPYIFYLCKFIYFVTKTENWTNTFESIKTELSKIKNLLQQLLAQTKQTTLFKTIVYRTIITVTIIIGVAWVIQMFAAFSLLFLDIAKLLPH